MSWREKPPKRDTTRWWPPGGDGTVNEVASGIAGSRTVLGIIPLGWQRSCPPRNSFNDIDKAIDVIAADYPKRCDYGTANGRPSSARSAWGSTPK